MSLLEPNITDSPLRRERERQELSLRELGHFAKCSHMTVHRLEQGTLDVAPATLARIARALRVPVAEIWPLDPEDSDAPGSGTEAARREASGA